jgi:hypothetical protein
MSSERTPAHAFQYTATFTSIARVVDPSQEDRFIAKASIQPLRGLLPADINPADNPDLLYIAADGAVAGLCNKNQDAISGTTALAIYRSCASKYISIDHDRSKVVGVVLYPGLTRFGTSEPITPEEAAALNEPFNISFAGVLWKVIAGQMARYIRKVDGALDSDALSMSWEIAFNDFSIGVGSKNLWDARVVGAQDEGFADLNKRLRSKGGSGKTEDGKDLFRIIGGDAVLLGFSIVGNPAAEVKGILPITEGSSCHANADTAPVETPAQVVAVQPVEEPAATQTEVPQTAAASAPSEESFITPAETRVTPNNASMKIESLAQLKDQWSEIRKLESSASVESFVDAFQKANDKHLADLTATQDLATSLEQSKAAAEQKATQLESALAQVRKELEDLKTAALAAEQNAKFQERMTALDEAFDLDDEDRQLLAPEVRSCADDAAFAAFKKKQDKLMDGKKKGKKAPPFMKKEHMKEEEEECSKASVSTETVVAAVASITPVAGQSSLPVGQVQVDTNLADEMTEAFGTAIKIDGETVSARKAKKAAAAPKE